MKKVIFPLILISILFMLLYGCSGGSSGGSSKSDGGFAADNLQPVAYAGEDQTVLVGGLALLDGSGSYDPDKNYPLTYEWQIVSKPEGSTAVLSEAEGASDSGGSQVFMEADVNGDYMVQLVVADSLGLASEPAFVVVSTGNSAPVANAGADQDFDNLGIIQLDGSQSFDPDGDPITFDWIITSKPLFSGATLSNSNAAQPTFEADLLGTYIIELVVTDDLGASSVADEVVVTSENVKPVADAGVFQVALVGDTVYLDGSGSFDANNDSLTYSWDMVSQPKGSVAVLSDPWVVGPNFVPDIQGLYLVSLVVNDGFLDSDPNNVTVLAVEENNFDDFIDALMKAIVAINGLDASDFNNDGNRDVLVNKIIVVILNYLKDPYNEDMLDKLKDDIGGKMDGCILDDPPIADQNDWIIDCDAQAEVYQHIGLAISILEDILSTQ